MLAGATALFVLAIAGDAAAAAGRGEPRPLRGVRQHAEARPKDLNSELPLESEFGFPGENVETGKTRTLFFTSGRLQAWETAVEQGLDRPIAGYGFGTEDETFVDRSYLFVSEAVENSFIGVFLQLGALGRRAARRRARAAARRVVARAVELDPERREYAAACAGAVVAGIVLAVPQSYLTSVGQSAHGGVLDRLLPPRCARRPAHGARASRHEQPPSESARAQPVLPPRRRGDGAPPRRAVRGADRRVRRHGRDRDGPRRHEAGSERAERRRGRPRRLDRVRPEQALAARAQLPDLPRALGRRGPARAASRRRPVHDRPAGDRRRRARRSRSASARRSSS